MFSIVGSQQKICADFHQEILVASLFGCWLTDSTLLCVFVFLLSTIRVNAAISLVLFAASVHASPAHVFNTNLSSRSLRSVRRPVFLIRREAPRTIYFLGQTRNFA